MEVFGSILVLTGTVSLFVSATCLLGNLFLYISEYENLTSEQKTAAGLLPVLVIVFPKTTDSNLQKAADLRAKAFVWGIALGPPTLALGLVFNGTI